jgi:hypothetical protein
MNKWYNKYNMMLRKITFILLLILSTKIIAQETGNLFLYIPSNEIMSDYLNLHSYLRAWDKDEINIDNERLSLFFINFVGIDTLQSLLFEAFLRYTKNKNIQSQILGYINSNNVNTNFANSLRKLYTSVPIVRQSDGKDRIQYSYANTEFDENINLFLFSERYTFDNEIGFLLFDNDWSNLSLNNPDNKDEASFFLMYGGGTNSIRISFRKYSNLDEKDIDTKYNLVFYNDLYRDNWKITTMPLEGILNRAGADKIVVAHGLGPDKFIQTIETATFNVYLYSKQNKILYEVSYFMNFSHVNIHFTERERIFNFLFFQTLFVFLS